MSIRALNWGILIMGALFLVWGLMRSDAALTFAGLIALIAGLLLQRRVGDGEAEVEALSARQAELERQYTILKVTNDTLAEGLQVALFLGDERGTLSHANRKARSLFKIDDPVGKTILAVTLSYDLEQLMVECAANQVPIQRELVLAYPEERNVICDAWPESGDSQRVYLSVYEITDLRRLERVRQDFVANVSHELRTPLTTIRLMAESLADEPNPSEATIQSRMQRVMSEVDRLSALSGDLLVLSSAESNPVVKRECDLAAIVRSSLDLLKSHAKDKGLTLEVALPPSLMLQANPSQLTQVVINLIDNAIKYTNQGSVNVSLQTEESNAVLTVADTGIGVASEHQSRLFERFYRVDKGRSRASGGTGLGLSIVRHIVEAHGGSVQLESSLNQGSTFRVILPL